MKFFIFIIYSKIPQENMSTKKGGNKGDVENKKQNIKNGFNLQLRENL